MEGGFRGEEVDVPAASYECVRNALWCGDGCGTTPPHLRLGIIAVIVLAPHCSIFPFPPPPRGTSGCQRWVRAMWHFRAGCDEAGRRQAARWQ